MTANKEPTAELWREQNSLRHSIWRLAVNLLRYSTGSGRKQVHVTCRNHSVFTHTYMYVVNLKYIYAYTIMIFDNISRLRRFSGIGSPDGPGRGDDNGPLWRAFTQMDWKGKLTTVTCMWYMSLRSHICHSSEWHRRYMNEHMQVLIFCKYRYIYICYNRRIDTNIKWHVCKRYE